MIALTGLALAARAVWRPPLLWFALLVAVHPRVGPLPVALGATGVLVLFFPTAPPCLASETGHLSGIVNLGPAMAGGLAPAPYRYGTGLSGNAVAAMPSVHFGMTTLLLIALWRTPLGGLRRLFGANAPGDLYAGDHYVVDGIAGSVIAGIAGVLSRSGSR